MYSSVQLPLFLVIVVVLDAILLRIVWFSFELLLLTRFLFVIFLVMLWFPLDHVARFGFLLLAVVIKKIQLVARSSEKKNSERE